MKILRSSERNFRYEFEKILKRKETLASPLETEIAKILEDVRLRGDKALISYTEKWDKHKIKDGKIAVTKVEIKKAYQQLKKEEITALKRAADNITRFYEKQPINNFSLKENGLELGLRFTPIEKVGIYVPGGKASYPSTVLMNAIPAKVAGVQYLAMVTPFVEGQVNPAVLVAADIAQVDHIYKVGGAHAIAALTYGTPSIPKVDKVVGPGNLYVTIAKKLVFGFIGIDMIAGPTEICILAGEQADPKIIAADLLSQAEHDENATCVLVTFDINFAHRVDGELRRQLRLTPRRSIAESAIKNRTFIIITKNVESAVGLINEIAPEHLELVIKDAAKIAEKIRNAGAIFLGHHAPVALGDYFAGPSHVLPTAGTAKFSSCLNVQDFLKATSIIGCDEKAFKRMSPDIIRLAEMESLIAHADSIRARL